MSRSKKRLMAGFRVLGWAARLLGAGLVSVAMATLTDGRSVACMAIPLVWLDSLGEAWHKPRRRFLPLGGNVSRVCQAERRNNLSKNDL